MSGMGESCHLSNESQVRHTQNDLERRSGPFCLGGGEGRAPQVTHGQSHRRGQPSLQLSYTKTSFYTAAAPHKPLTQTECASGTCVTRTKAPGPVSVSSAAPGGREGDGRCPRPRPCGCDGVRAPPPTEGRHSDAR